MSAQLEPRKNNPFRVLTQPTSYADLEDHELVLACQNKNEGAFNALYKRHYRYAHSVIHRLAPDWSSAHDDIVQEVFVRVWRSIDSIRNPRAFKTWLNQMITNLFYDELRKRPRNMIISIDEPLKGSDGEEGAQREIADTKSQPDETFERNETIAQINQAIEQLPERFKNVIVLRELHGLSYEEIANMTNTELGTVKSRIARAKSKMQSHLESLKEAA